jgi:hypothetical protein
LASVRSVLELLVDIGDRHARGVQAGGLQVVPVLIDAIGEHRSLIRTAVESLGGVYLDAADAVQGVQGVARPDLVAVVGTALRVPVGGGQFRLIEVKSTGGRVQVLVDGLRAPEITSPGLQTMSAAATCLFSDDLAISKLGVISYAEASLDADHAAALFHLFSDQAAIPEWPSLRTLVVLVEAQRSVPERHCGTGVSALFRAGDRLERRKPWSADSADIHALRPHDASSRLILFTGAGFSRSSKLPTGSGLRDDALRRFLDSSESIEQVNERFHSYVQANERLLPREREMTHEQFARQLTLERVLREEVWRDGDAEGVQHATIIDFAAKNSAAMPGRAVTALHSLMAHRKQLAVVTVNFDTMIESAGTAKAFASDEEFEQAPTYIDHYWREGGEVPVLKLHGTIDRPDSIIATVEAVARGLAPAKVAALRSLLASDKPTQWVYVGYSMRDGDVTDVLGLQEFQRSLDESWVSPFPIVTAEEFADARRDYANRRDFWARCITATADNFLEELAAAW